MRYPDFFIIGAPKCGTTALAGWLSENPGIFMCTPKEPNYYSYRAGQVLPYMASARTPDQYFQLFAKAHPHQIIGDASTTYLRSEEAVCLLLKDNPLARLIVCLRNPLERVQSTHSQRMKSGWEPERDFATAWTKSKTDYIDACSAGQQVDRLLRNASRKQVLFLLNEDMREDPRATYESVLHFVGAPDDGKSDFPSLNERAVPRSLMLARILKESRGLRSNLGIRLPTGLRKYTLPLMNRSARVEEKGLSPILRNEIVEMFRPDVELLQNLIERDLEHWLHTT